jgi:transcription elongation factor GreA
MMLKRPTYLTPKGLEKLEEEINYLCTVKRAESAELLHETQSGGDNIDNTEYQAVYYEQILLETRISSLRLLLANAQLIDTKLYNGKIQLGSSVVVQDETQQVETYRIVGPLEANPELGQISDECPLGRALLDHEAGEEVRVVAPDGVILYRIVDVS